MPLDAAYDGIRLSRATPQKTRPTRPVLLTTKDDEGTVVPATRAGMPTRATKCDAWPAS